MYVEVFNLISVVIEKKRPLRSLITSYKCHSPYN